MKYTKYVINFAGSLYVKMIIAYVIAAIVQHFALGYSGFRVADVITPAAMALTLKGYK